MIHVLQEHNIEDDDTVTKIIGVFHSLTDAEIKKEKLQDIDARKERLSGISKYMYFITSTRIFPGKPSLRQLVGEYISNKKCWGITSKHEADYEAKALLGFISTYFDTHSDEKLFTRNTFAARLRGEVSE